MSKTLNNPTRDGFITSVTKLLIHRNIQFSCTQSSTDDALFKKARFIRQYDLTEEKRIKELLYVIDGLYNIRQRNIKRNRENANSTFNKIFNPKKLQEA